MSSSTSGGLAEIPRPRARARKTIVIGPPGSGIERGHEPVISRTTHSSPPSARLAGLAQTPSTPRARPQRPYVIPVSVHRQRVSGSLTSTSPAER
jgi:hypothetical protein